jgi:hypothetical protein
MNDQVELSGKQLMISLFFISFFSESGSLYVAQTDLELAILLPHPPKCWNYGHGPGSFFNFFKIIANVCMNMRKCLAFNTISYQVLEESSLASI